MLRYRHQILEEHPQRFAVKATADQSFLVAADSFQLRAYAHVFGLSLIAAGVVSLLTSIWQYHSALTYLWQSDFRPIAGAKESRVRTPLFAVAVGLTVIGLMAFVAVFVRAV